MSTFTLPLNARLVTEEAYTASGFTFPQTGYVPTQFLVSLGFADVTGTAASTVTRNAFVVPAGYIIDDVKLVNSTIWAGTSVGTVDINIGTGATPTNVVGTANAGKSNVVRAAGASGGNSSFGVKLAVDTTISYQVSVSGAAAAGCSLASLTAGATNIFITVGVPYDLSTRG